MHGQITCITGRKQILHCVQNKEQLLPTWIIHSCPGPQRLKEKKEQKLLVIVYSARFSFFIFFLALYKANILTNPLHFHTDSLLLLAFLLVKVTRQIDFVRIVKNTYFQSSRKEIWLWDTKYFLLMAFLRANRHLVSIEISMYSRLSTWR